MKINYTANCTFTPTFKLLNIDKTLIYLPLNSYGFTLENDQTTRCLPRNVARNEESFESRSSFVSTSTLTSPVLTKFTTRIFQDSFLLGFLFGGRSFSLLLPWRFLMFPKDWPGSIRARPRGITADQGHWFSKPAELLPGNVSTKALIKPGNTPSSPPRHRSSPGRVRLFPRELARKRSHSVK